MIEVVLPRIHHVYSLTCIVSWRCAARVHRQHKPWPRLASLCDEHLICVQRLCAIHTVATTCDTMRALPVDMCCVQTARTCSSTTTTAALLCCDIGVVINVFAKATMRIASASLYPLSPRFQFTKHSIMLKCIGIRQRSEFNKLEST